MATQQIISPSNLEASSFEVGGFVPSRIAVRRYESPVSLSGPFDGVCPVGTNTLHVPVGLGGRVQIQLPETGQFIGELFVCRTDDEEPTAVLSIFTDMATTLWISARDNGGFTATWDGARWQVQYGSFSQNMPIIEGSQQGSGWNNSQRGITASRNGETVTADGLVRGPLPEVALICRLPRGFVPLRSNRLFSCAHVIKGGSDTEVERVVASLNGDVILYTADGVASDGFVSMSSIAFNIRSI